jgi:hypothetical protein
VALAAIEGEAVFLAELVELVDRGPDLALMEEDLIRKSSA